MTLAPREFARSLQTLSDEDLGVLLTRRPEAVAAARAPRPAWADLAEALSRPRELTFMVARLDRFLGQVIELAALERGRLDAAAAAGEGLPREDLGRAAVELRRWGLAATDGDGTLHLAPGVEAMVWDPGGLGRPALELLENLNVTELRQVAMLHGLSGAALPKLKADLVPALGDRLVDPERIVELVRGAPPAARAALDALREAGGSTARGMPAGAAWARSFMAWSWHPQWAHAAERDGVTWLTERAVVLPDSEARTSVAVPREIERALRGRVFARWDVTPPALALAPLREERHPIDLVSALDTLLEAWRHAPPIALKEGGVPKREIKRAAQRLGHSEDETAALTLLAFEAHLLRERELVPEKRSRSWRRPRVLESRQAVIEPSEEAERWQGLSEPERWLELARVWLRAYGMDAAARQGPASRERLVLDLLAEIPDGRGASAASIGAALAWRHPAFFPDSTRGTAAVRRVGAGLALLGAGGTDPAVGLNAVGRLTLLHGADAGALRRAFPAPADRCVVTADHRIVVSGPPGGELARMLRRVADVVSVRPARVYRVTEASLGRAFDGGVTAAGVLDVLRRHAAEPVPPNVVALVEDVAARHGCLRVGSADVYVVADDPARLERAARERALAGMRRISPTVAVIEGTSRDAVMAALRRAGLMPVLDGASPPPAAAPAASSREPARPEPPRRPATGPSAPDAAETARLVSALRAAPAVRARGDAPRSTERSLRDTLADAARARRTMEIGYRGASGEVRILTGAPYALHQGQVYVQQRQGNAFSLDLRCILWAAPADASDP